MSTKTTTQVIASTEWNWIPGTVYSNSKQKSINFKATHKRLDFVKFISENWIYNTKTDAFYKPEWLDFYMNTNN